MFREEVIHETLIINGIKVKISDIIETIQKVGSYNAAKYLNDQTKMGIIDAKYVIDCIEKEEYYKLINIMEIKNHSSEEVRVHNRAEGIVVTYKAKSGEVSTVTPNDKKWSHVKSLFKDDNPLIERYEKEFMEKAKLQSASQNNLFVKKRGNIRYYVVLILLILGMIYLLLR